jgi:Rrf2 family protein
MRISTRVRYGTRALLDIAENCDDGPVCLKDIARRQGVSQPYLEQLILLLKAAGFVRSVRGARGGFLLTRDPGEINMAQVVATLGWETEVVECVRDPDTCTRSGECGVRDFWRRVSKSVESVLVSTTLADLIHKRNC